ncbi:MAG: hypothetical protein NC311_11535 [Muribaculaceae bacterium]|nr:hypothetical protein [Muribaculaceae bacterium]
MNKKRRNALHAVLDALSGLRKTVDRDEALAIIRTAKDSTEECADEEQDALDARPESLQWSTANEDMGENISDLWEAAGNLDAVLEDCEKMETYDYQKIEKDVIETVNLIRQAIHR